MMMMVERKLLIVNVILLCELLFCDKLLINDIRSTEIVIDHN